MTDSVDGYYLAAYCINATSLSRVEVEWIVVFRDPSGDWVDRDGNRIHAFHVEPIGIPLPSVPDGWIEYLHVEADRTCRPPKINLIEALGLTPKPPAKIERRL